MGCGDIGAMASAMALARLPREPREHSVGEQLGTKEKTVGLGGLEESRRRQRQGDIPNCG